MSFRTTYKKLKAEGYTNVRIAAFMKISIRSFYYFHKGGRTPSQPLEKKIKKTFVRVIKYERKQKLRAEKKRIKAEKKLIIEKKKKKEIIREPEPIEEKIREPQLFGFNESKIHEKRKKYPKQYEVSYSIKFEYRIVPKYGEAKQEINYTVLSFDPDVCILHMHRFLECIAVSEDVYLLHYEWIYDVQPLLMSHF